jgi:hypothetical protein
MRVKRSLGQGVEALFAVALYDERTALHEAP